MGRTSLLVDKIMDEILQYESDTFDGSKISRRAAKQMADQMITDLVLDEIGFSIDGELLTKFYHKVEDA